jgi:UDP-N-acetylmuramate: L-alanyl-gamma-D-glutamyl-meso-diaminopimelate ligase
LAAIAAAHHAGVAIDVAARALAEFKSVKRRLEIRGEKRGIIVYDDFAHHPTAIATTLAGLRAKIGNAKIIAVLECASNTMRMGVYKNDLALALKDADEVIFLRPTNDWGIDAVAAQLSQDKKVCARIEDIMDHLVLHGKPGNHIVLMSNGGFGGLPEKLLKVL